MATVALSALGDRLRKEPPCEPSLNSEKSESDDGWAVKSLRSPLP